MSATPPPVPVSFHYELPPDLIAQDPAPQRGDSRLLRVDPGAGRIERHVFRELPSLLRAGDLLVFNDSRVLPARLWTRRCATGGRIELLLVRAEPVRDPHAWRALARPARRLREGSQLVLTDLAGAAVEGPDLTVLAVDDDGFVQVTAGQDLAEVAERWGEMPLPPYIKRQPADPELDRRLARDRHRYQTVFARHPGSVAAPTAGLHFETSLLSALADRGVTTAWITLHIGPGTFRTPTRDQIATRRLHEEVFHYPTATDTAIRLTRERNGRVIAVGTTSLRVLETVRRLVGGRADPDSLPATTESDGERHWRCRSGQNSPLFEGTARHRAGGWEVSGTTRLFIRPPDTIAAADGLLTNFHLPGSSLLMLVAALAPEPLWRDAYVQAVAHRFRFYSYGDAMLILTGEESAPHAES